MRTCILRSHFYLPKQTHLRNSPALFLNKSVPQFRTRHPKKGSNTHKPLLLKPEAPTIKTPAKQDTELAVKVSSNGYSRFILLGAVSFGVAMLLAGMEDQKAMAFGPQGPLMEDFWDNMRRYGLYALTVSTGALYTIFQPIVELLKNPISAILVIVILVGSFYIVSQVVSAMVGTSDFAYEYGY